MPDPVEFNPVDSIAAGAIGEPGRRTFYIQATKGGATLTVLVEKAQVAILAERVNDLLGQVATDHPEDPLEIEASLTMQPAVVEPVVPLFRATVMGLGFDPERKLVVLELYERPPGAVEGDDDADGDEHDPGQTARLYATRAQMRALAARGAESVAAGRPPCPFCRLPLDAEGHVCPATNGHATRS